MMTLPRSCSFSINTPPRPGVRPFWLMLNRPEDAFRCGPMALDRIRASIRLADAFDDRIRLSRSTVNGISLAELRALANELGMNYQMAKRQPGSPVILPSVVHWKV